MIGKYGRGPRSMDSYALYSQSVSQRGVYSVAHGVQGQVSVAEDPEAWWRHTIGAV